MQSANPLDQLSVAIEQLLSMPSISTASASSSAATIQQGQSSQASLPNPAVIRSKTTGSIEEGAVPTHKRASSLAMTDSICLITEEDRKKIKMKIVDAYRSNCHSFDDLLNVCVDMEEDLLFSAAPTRLDYYKIGVKFDSRIEEIVTRKNRTAK